MHIHTETQDYLLVSFAFSPLFSFSKLPLLSLSSHGTLLGTLLCPKPQNASTALMFCHSFTALLQCLAQFISFWTSFFTWHAKGKQRWENSQWKFPLRPIHFGSCSSLHIFWAKLFPVQIHAVSLWYNFPCCLALFLASEVGHKKSDRQMEKSHPPLVPHVAPSCPTKLLGSSWECKILKNQVTNQATGRIEQTIPPLSLLLHFPLSLPYYEIFQTNYHQSSVVGGGLVENGCALLKGREKGDKKASCFTLTSL